MVLPQSWGARGGAGTGLRVCCVAWAVLGTELGSHPHEIQETPNWTGLHTMNNQRETMVQKRHRYCSESTSRLPGVELGCTILDLMNLRRFVFIYTVTGDKMDFSSYSFSFFLSLDFIKELVGLFHKIVIILQSVQRKERKLLSQISIQKWFGMLQKGKTLPSMPWLIFRRVPEKSLRFWACLAYPGPLSVK